MGNPTVFRIIAKVHQAHVMSEVEKSKHGQGRQPEGTLARQRLLAEAGTLLAAVARL